jgi:lysylphosphatidylglycerol synthetase-like protein (DUF2156 family)
MGQKTDPPETSLIEALHENWLHARHLESERLWFTNIYAIIVVGVLTLREGNKYSYQTFLFLIIFSILGLIVTLKTAHDYENHIAAIERITQRLNLSEYMVLPTSFTEAASVWKVFKVRNTFMTFYVVMIVIWIYMLLSGQP